jgi:DNA-directed RNA polymerase specialized sigma24 family protein
LTQSEAYKFHKSAIILCNKWGFNQMAQDLAQDTIVRLLTGHGQTVSQALIDSIRFRCGRNHDKIAFLRCSQPNDMDYELLDHSPWGRVDARIDLERIFNLTDIRERRIILGEYLGGLRQIDLARELGISESRVTQLRKSGLVKLRMRYDRG